MDQNRAERLGGVPPSFEQQMAPNYLGSPTVVSGILAPFLTEILEWVKQRAAGTMTAGEMTDHAHERAVEFARIFAGEDAAYLPMAGWNSRMGGLNETIKADLGQYWQAQRSRHNDDPYQVLYAWLLWAVVDSMKHEDETMVDATMGQRVQQLVRLLTGTTKRKVA